MAKAKATPEENQEQEPEVLQFGNQDTDKRHDISRLNVKSSDNLVVVRHFSTVSLANGQYMEDPTTNRFQVYDERTFKSMNTQPVKDGKQLKSQFQELGLNVDVLHNPSK